MSDRAFSRKRQTQKALSKPVALIAYEGKFNKTESDYFNSLNRICEKYTIKTFSTEKTDPLGLFLAIEKKWGELELNSDYGDKAFIVLDLDVSSDKAQQIADLQDKTDNIQFIISNPCIEIWFLNHFQFSTKAYPSSKSVKRELANYIPNYKENTKVFLSLKPNLEDAIAYTQRQVDFGTQAGYEWPSKDFNPRTDMGYLVSTLLDINN